MRSVDLTTASQHRRQRPTLSLPDYRTAYWAAARIITGATPDGATLARLIQAGQRVLTYGSSAI